VPLIAFWPFFNYNFTFVHSTDVAVSSNGRRSRRAGKNRRIQNIIFLIKKGSLKQKNEAYIIGHLPDQVRYIQQMLNCCCYYLYYHLERYTKHNNERTID